MALTFSAATLLEKVAYDGGFPQSLGTVGAWAGYASTKAPLKVWLTSLDDGRFAAALSERHVAEALGELGSPIAPALPTGASAALATPTLDGLRVLVRRAFRLSRTLPNALLLRFEQAVPAVLGTTEVERIVKQRVGQDCFRKGLLEYWEGRCAVTGLAIPPLLRASHIKPWADCASDAERLDVFNGLLLAAHLDAAFDGGLVTVDDDGALQWSPLLTDEARELLGVNGALRVEKLVPEHRKYLAWHRAKVFRQDAASPLTSQEGGPSGDG